MPWRTAAVGGELTEGGTLVLSFMHGEAEEVKMTTANVKAWSTRLCGGRGSASRWACGKAQRRLLR